MFRICKDFYFSTLSINAKRVENTHENKATGSAALYRRGKHVKRCYPECRDSVRKHMKSIPWVKSHYYRRDTNKEYVDGTLNL